MSKRSEAQKRRWEKFNTVKALYIGEMVKRGWKEDTIKRRTSYKEVQKFIGVLARRRKRMSKADRLRKKGQDSFNISQGLGWFIK